MGAKTTGREGLTGTVSAEAKLQALSRGRAVIEFTMDGRVAAANAEFLAMTGYAPEEIIGEAHRVLWPTEAGDDHEALWRALRAGEDVSGEFTRVGRDGRRFWIRVTYNPIRDAAGEPVLVVAQAVEITGEKLLHADYSAQLAAINKSAAVIEFDLEGMILSANQNFLYATGYALSEIVGRHHRIFMPPEEVSRQAYEDFWTQLRAGVFHSAQYRRLKKNGDEIWFQASYNPVHDLDGRPSKIVKYAIDVTEAVLSKQSEVRLQAAAAAAEASARAKGDFLANMSHELRTPLTSILGFARLMGQDAQLAARHRKPVETIHRAGEALLTVVNDILDFSKLEAGALTLSPAPLRVSEFADGLDTLLRGQAEEKGLALTCEVRRDAWVAADGARLRQVFLNLLGNAIKFTDQGAVRLELDVDVGADGRTALLGEVIDTGVGVPPDELEGVFERFTQLDSSATRRHGGAGLGLAIVRQLIVQMGGEVGVRSDGATGSTFWLRIPVEPCTAPEPVEPETGQADEALAPVRVLMADDHAANRALIEAMLGALPVELTLVEDGAQALAAVERERFDLVLMDVHMPVMDGLEATRAIRALPGVRGAIPIVAVTASVLPDQVAACLDAGMNDHLGKPVDFAALIRTINAHAVAAGEADA